MIKDINKLRFFWWLFAISVLLPISDIILNSLGFSFLFLTILKFVLPLIIFCLHAFYIFGFKNALFLLIPSFVTGLLFEIIGVNFGVIFGGTYSYNQTSLGPLIFKVPILIPFFWSFFIYTGYLISSSFLVWLNIEKPSIKNNKKWLLFGLIIFDALVVVAIDLFMDPIMVLSGNWTWVNGGAYFGVPLANFFGWFLVTVISCGFFRCYEYFFPIKKTTSFKSLLLIPVIGYLSLVLLFSILALNLELHILVVIGSLVMLPTALLNLFLYFKSNQK